MYTCSTCGSSSEKEAGVCHGAERQTACDMCGLAKSSCACWCWIVGKILMALGLVAAIAAWVIFLFAVPLILIAIVQRELAVGYWLSFFYGIIFIYLTLGTLLVPKPSECCLTEAKTIASAGGVLALVLIAFAFRGAREKRRRR